MERSRRRQNPPFGNLALLGLETLFEKSNLTAANMAEYFLGGISESNFGTKHIVSSPNRIRMIKLHGSINWQDSDNGDVFIVPPTWNKSDERVRKLWEIAFNELTQAKRIIIIGYSFPETDIYVKSLLALALNENRILQNIYFINPDESQVKSRCLSLLDGYFHKYCDYKEWSFSQFIESHDGRTFIMDKLNRNFNG